MSRMKAKNLLPTLQMGHYLLEIDEKGKAFAIPISSRESQRIVIDILGRA